MNVCDQYVHLNNVVDIGICVLVHCESVQIIAGNNRERELGLDRRETG